MNSVTVKDVVIGDGQPKIVVPIVATTAATILAAAAQIATLDCDMAEWRVDFYEQVGDFKNVAQLSKKVVNELNGKPLLLTFRTKKEGGEREFSDQDYFELYRVVLEQGSTDLLDVELFMDETKVAATIQLAHQKGVKVVLCNHDFVQTPAKDEIIRRLVAMQAKGADICKIAVMPQSSADVLTLLAATEKMTEVYADRPIVTMSMGKLGMISRISGAVFGSALTFAAAEQASAPGQLSVAEMRKLLVLIS